MTRAIDAFEYERMPDAGVAQGRCYTDKSKEEVTVDSGKFE